ncbi:MAG: solute:sodium symporter family transporter, partial [Myxococcales bacterium]|nr:solute:sodium symporter family transporter [Myxococcales bacterium]
PAAGAKAAMAVGLLSYGFFTFFGAQVFPDLHWLHGYAISFAAGVLVMLVSGLVAPKSAAQIAASDAHVEAPVDMAPWRHAKGAALCIVLMTIGIYVALTALSG